MDKLLRRIPEESDQIELPFELLEKYLFAVLIVAAATAVMFMIGRDVLGEGVIALLYLAPVSWIAARWGQGPGIAAAVSTALAFNFFFIPPYYTFYIGSLEGWLLLGIFLAVAVLVVGRIQSGFSRAQAREREAVFMYELSSALAGLQRPEAVARVLAAHIQQLYLATLVQVFIEGKGQSMIASAPVQGTVKGKPDLVLPILAAFGLAGEIRLWQGEILLPTADDRLLKNFTNQAALALERARLAQIQVGKEKQA